MFKVAVGVAKGVGSLQLHLQVNRLHIGEVFDSINSNGPSLHVVHLLFFYISYYAQITIDAYLTSI